jgi:Na+/proline symporter
LAESFQIHAVFLLLYLISLIIVGARKAGSIRSHADFSLAGRRLSVPVLVGTLLATWIGTGSIFGNAEETYRVGVPALLLPISGGVGIIVLYFLAARIRRFGQFTIQDILEDRFGVATRLLGTLTLLMAYVIIVSYQYRAGAAVVETIFPAIGHTGAVLGVAAFVILYTALAGMFSVAYTDLANGILMIIGIFVALPILLIRAGGIGGVLSSFEPQSRSLFGAYSATHLISILLPSLLLIIGDANMFQRFFSARDPQAARRSAFGMFFGVLLLEIGIILTALVGKSMIAKGMIPPPDIPGHIIVQTAFYGLPPLLGALLIATVVAVVVSTADSYLLAPSTSLVRDIYERFLARERPARHSVFVGRAVVVLLGATALGLAFLSDRFFSVALFAYTIYGAGITPVILAAFFWPGATRAGAVASMLTGVLTAVGWKIFVTGGVLAQWFDAAEKAAAARALRQAAEANIEPVLPALALSLIVLIGVSLLTRRSPRSASAF